MASERSRSRAVLITGCSTGIGRATAERLGRGGWTVYASARNLDSIQDLTTAGCKVLALDVTSEPSRRAAVEAVEAASRADTTEERVAALEGVLRKDQGEPLNRTLLMKFLSSVRS